MPDGRLPKKMRESTNTLTTFENKCEILATVWLYYRDDIQFVNFIEHNDTGLHLAHTLSEGLAKGTEMSTKMVDKTFDLLLVTLAVDDIGFEDLEDLLTVSDNLR